MSRILYTPEQKAFFKEYVPGHSAVQVAEEFNKRFSPQINATQVKNYKNHHRLKSLTKKRGGNGPVWTPELKAFLIANNYGRTAQEMADLINKEFGRNFSAVQLKGVRARLKLNSGLTGHWQKGHVPPNKGKKGLYASGCEKSWFKKGHSPWNKMKVGDEAWTTDGYLKVKIAEPNKWKHKHILVWEKHNGKVPEGFMLTFRNGNHADCSIENLVLIRKAENAIMNRQGLRSESAELTDAGIILARLKHKISKTQKEVFK